MEGAVAAADARARQAQVARIKLQIGEMQHAVGGPLEIGGQPRQAAGQVGEEAVVEPPHPGLGLAEHPRLAACRRGRRAGRS